MSAGRDAAACSGTRTPVLLGGHEFGTTAPVVMAIVNRTPDSFYAAGRAPDEDAGRAAVDRAVAAGAEIVDIGGVRAGHGPEVDVAEECRRVVGLVAWTVRHHPGIAVSVDTWRAPVARAVCDAGAHLLNDTWAGWDPEIARVAAEYGVGLVCSHTGGATPRTDPFRVRYPGRGPDAVVDDVVDRLRRAAAAAVELGVDARSVLVDPTHDFGKNSWHSLALLRHTGRLAALGHPVLMALSRKDFVGETLAEDDPADRLPGTLAASAVAAWSGACVFRAHDVAATRQVLDMVAAIRGELAPARAVRGLQ